MSLIDFDNQFAFHGIICGVDEAGAGPLAGPVCAAAVIMPRDIIIEGINDSKKLTEKKREELYPRILEACTAYNIAFVGSHEIDKINILQARLKAMRLAVSGLEANFALVDGNRCPALEIPSELVPKGDSRSYNIACASILAKVARDAAMKLYHEKYPQYGFDRHKGYGTKAHFEAIKKHGLCPIHRRSFCGS